MGHGQIDTQRERKIKMMMRMSRGERGRGGAEGRSMRESSSSRMRKSSVSFVQKKIATNLSKEPSLSSHELIECAALHNPSRIEINDLIFFVLCKIVSAKL